MGAQVRRNAQAYSQLLFGRERREGKDSHSRQWRLSMAVFLNRNKRPLAAPIEVAELLSEKPPPSQSFSPSLLSAGRGGSVSRRDHNQAARNRAHLAWAHKPGEKVKPIPSYSSGEGVRGRGASLREAASPPESPHVSPSHSSGEGIWGRGASLREAASPPASYQNTLNASGRW